MAGPHVIVANHAQHNGLEPAGFGLLVWLVVAAHYAILAYIACGGYLTWRWPRTLWTHLAACAWGLAIVTMPTLQCPLTYAEKWARGEAGMTTYTGGFIDRYVQGVLYPSRYNLEVQFLVALLVIVSWAGLYAKHRRRDMDSRHVPGLRRAGD